MKTVLLYSGGLDSTVLLYLLRHGNQEVTPLFVSYGQRHFWELRAAQGICALLDIRLQQADVTATWLKGASSLTGEGDLNGPATVVPGRNLIFLSLAFSTAQTLGAQSVAFAPHSGDAAIYADCRPEFCDSARAVARNAGLELIAPFLTMTKRDIVGCGRELSVPFHLTRSCYESTPEPCGKCGACIEREKAFRA